MSDLPVKILRMLSVTLSREKQLQVEHDFRAYADATNFAIKSIVKKQIPNKAKAEEALFDDIVNRFMVRALDDSGACTLSDFGKRFRYDLVAEFVPLRVKIATEHGMQTIDRTPEEVRQMFVQRFSGRYVQDVLTTAAAEISRHRKLAKTLITIRGKVPHFKYGTMILSGLLISINEKAVELMTLSGERAPIPFDKRSRNREAGILHELAEQKRKYQRIRLMLNKEGFLNIDVKINRK